jgi:8-oxo-dGTP pyrophosphatase MutT (NUDIX family)
MAHIHEKIDFTVEVFVVHKGRVLLRFHDKYKIWLSVGGHVELNEDPNEAAIREVKEEVGLDIELLDTREWKGKDKHYKELISPVALNRHSISENHEHVTLVYFAKTNSNKVIPEKESDVWKWCDESDIDNFSDIRPVIAHYAKRALREVK